MIPESVARLYVPFVVDCADDEPKGGTDGIHILAEYLLYDRGFSSIIQTTMHINQHVLQRSRVSCALTGLQHQHAHLLVLHAGLSENG